MSDKKRMRMTGSVMRFRLAGLFPAALVLLAASACAQPEAAAPQPTPDIPSAPSPGGGIRLEIAAMNTAFDKTVLKAKAGSRVTLVFSNNEDIAEFHNVAIYKDSSAAEAVMVGPFAGNGKSITAEFNAPDVPGTYFFRCDIHPFLMKGDFIVE